MIKWLCFFPLHLFVVFICWWSNPLACLFVTKRLRTDKVKRLNKETFTFDREYLYGIFYLWQTHDNAVDEGWWGLYNIPFLQNTTQEDYDNSKLIRYWCRVWWLSRNTAYGWTYKLFSVPQDEGFQIKKDLPLFGKFYNSINIGWKSHKNIENKLYAGRILGIRKYE